MCATARSRCPRPPISRAWWTGSGCGDTRCDHPLRNGEENSPMSQSRRQFLGHAGLLGLGVVAGSRSASAQTTQTREFVVGQGGDVARLDPHMSTGTNDIRVSFNIFDNLISRHPDDKLYPALATEWKNTAPETWTFKLRQGVKFHNGDPFTSADAKS